MLPGGASPDLPCGDDCALHAPKGQPQHVRVRTDDGLVPGVLSEWRQVGGDWQGWVVHVRRLGGVWVEVREWVPADEIERA